MVQTPTIDLAEAEGDLSRICAEVNSTGRPITILKDGRPWVTIQPASSHVDPVDVAVDFMNEYADVFEGLSR
jgi:antitoxin Phd